MKFLACTCLIHQQVHKSLAAMVVYRPDRLYLYTRLYFKWQPAYVQSRFHESFPPLYYHNSHIKPSAICFIHARHV
ncbi:hypothetical protein IW261DRAFT_1445329 [Armillaria novae-zelandiae]|uniref:Uncharacterized protein n=1 Tax=Armillaria novae-zelandiae TaxID=153914 RepID=A0AA39PS13_9AGAR|nr:hypothetical protein IW261DRAFT_1520671 [Armillaria novae-zelandiae]KAK0489467.1 hypothetical protein IW261DRAFT_1445329 [Armillaria novae-zelandiae]